MVAPMRVDDLDYDLPEALIATDPLPQRDAARLLVVPRGDTALQHRAVRDLPELLAPGTLMVLNDTRVIPARLRGTKPSGGQAEVFLLRPDDPSGITWRALGRASKALRPGMEITFAPGFSAHIDARHDDATLSVTLRAEQPWAAIEAHGEIPLPPYLRRRPTEADKHRYQTVFAARPGAVAAPTAGLHLSAALLDALDARGVTRATVTLHVGAGTFAPIAVDNLDAHPMHAEWYEVPEETQRRVRQARAEGRPVFAVGTTAVRALESWGLDGAPAGDTRLLIQPGYHWKVVDKLLTNFHLPRSTLLALVMAFAGQARIRAAYAEAIAARYRFFSYGDAMLLG
jgi:S-adenosylmethionine:tRNA ribosyltransferase-isomerase